VLHFVWFRKDEYNRAKAVFGEPDYVHPGYDTRALRDIAPGDTVVFARGEHDQPVSDRIFDDLNEEGYY
jgi:hypothetical protein